MKAEQIEQLDSEVDAFSGSILSQAAEIAADQAAMLAEITARWEALYQSIPERQLRTLAVSVAVHASMQSADDNAKAADAEVERFANLALSAKRVTEQVSPVAAPARQRPGA